MKALFTPLRSISLPFWLLAGLLTALRCLHLSGPIDEPHAWRQMDTAQYIRTYAEEGIDLLHPSVAWMGAHKTVTLEFPLPEALVSLPLRLAGSENHAVMRLCFLLFFLGAAVYLFAILRYMTHARLAEWVTLIFMSMPLAVFYSRAVHIDFSVVFLAHAMLYHLLRAVGEQHRGHLVAGTLWGILAWMVKSPYVFYLYLPLAVWMLEKKPWAFLLRSLPLWLLPPLAFWLWSRHTFAVNSAAPDWYFLRDYSKFIHKDAWYFGTWAQRMNPASWALLAQRIHTGIWPWGLSLAGLAGLVLLYRLPRAGFWYAWLAGAVLYVLIFFNLNLIHDYYQIPLLVPAALLLGAGLYTLFTWLEQRHALQALGVTWALVLLITGLNVQQAERSGQYYRVEQLPLDAAACIRTHTPPQARVAVTWGGLDCRAPLILYPAHRYGWQVQEVNLSPKCLAALRREGATHFAWVRDTAAAEPSPGMPPRSTAQRFPLSPTQELCLWDLRKQDLPF